jgi:hypothetical protein
MSADTEEGVHSFLDLAEVFLAAKRCLLKPWDFPPQSTYRRNISGCETARGEAAAAVAERCGAHQLSDLCRILPRRCIDGVRIFQANEELAALGASSIIFRNTEFDACSRRTASDYESIRRIEA